mmetsp:Transcript_15521/g.48869  ORF Transcript_15521/g.48869 Transcript_15521/m.48869 type:complete len:383 (+) Transcript_15521:424-1572(+)
MRRCVTRNSRSPHVSEDEDVGENNNQYRNARSSPRRNARKSCDGRSYYKRTKPCRSATKNLFRVARSTRRRSGPPRRVDERRPPRKLLKPHPMNCSSTRRAKASRRDGPSLSPSRRRRSPSCSRCIPRCAGRTRRTCPRFASVSEPFRRASTALPVSRRWRYELYTPTPLVGRRRDPTTPHAIEQPQRAHTHAVTAPSRAWTAWRLPVSRSRRRPAGAARADRSSSTPSSSRRGADTHAPLPPPRRWRPRCTKRSRRDAPTNTHLPRRRAIDATERTPIKQRRTCPRPSFGSSTSNRDIFGATRGGRCSRRARPRPTLLMIYLPDMKNRATTRCRSRPRCGRPWICRGRTRIDLYLLPKRMLWIPRRRLLPGYCGSLIGMRR